jgi:hypothetical protein
MRKALNAGRCLLALTLLAAPAIDGSFAGAAAGAGKRDALAGATAKSRSVPAGMPQLHRPPVAQGRGLRNAIGVPIAHPEGLMRGNGERHEVTPAAPGHATQALGATPGESGGVAKLQGSIGAFRTGHPSPSPTPAKAAPNPATIGGNAAVRPGSSPSARLGGPARTETGINGTAVRPKH